jgi:hypothetical protein
MLNFQRHLIYVHLLMATYTLRSVFNDDIYFTLFRGFLLQGYSTVSEFTDPVRGVKASFKVGLKRRGMTHTPLYLPYRICEFGYSTTYL